jgi:hypothetical protein
VKGTLPHTAEGTNHSSLYFRDRLVSLRLRLAKDCARSGFTSNLDERAAARICAAKKDIPHRRNWCTGRQVYLLLSKRGGETAYGYGTPDGKEHR